MICACHYTLFLFSRSALLPMSYIIHCTVVGLLMYGVLTLYRITYIALACLMLVAMPLLTGTLRYRFSAKPKTE